MRSCIAFCQLQQACQPLPGKKSTPSGSRAEERPKENVRVPAWRLDERPTENVRAPSGKTPFGGSAIASVLRHAIDTLPLRGTSRPNAIDYGAASG